MQFTIGKGSNFATPLANILNYGKPSRIVWAVMFDKSCEYPQLVLNGQPYNGFNKAAGIAFNLLKPNDNAAMLGWRWNALTQLIELTPYFNVDGDNVYDESNMLTCVPGDSVSVIVTIEQTKLVSVIVRTTRGRIFKSVQFKNTFGWTSIYHIVNIWFGGQLPAPQTVSANVTKIA